MYIDSRAYVGIRTSQDPTLSVNLLNEALNPLERTLEDELFQWNHYARHGEESPYVKIPRGTFMVIGRLTIKLEKNGYVGREDFQGHATVKQHTVIRFSESNPVQLLHHARIVDEQELDTPNPLHITDRRRFVECMLHTATPLEEMVTDIFSTRVVAPSLLSNIPIDTPAFALPLGTILRLAGGNELVLSENAWVPLDYVDEGQNPTYIRAGAILFSKQVDKQPLVISNSACVVNHFQLKAMGTSHKSPTIHTPSNQVWSLDLTLFSMQKREEILMARCRVPEDFQATDCWLFRRSITFYNSQTKESISLDLHTGQSTG